MHYLYRIHKIFNIKKELKEVYTNQAIEALALSIIGIFIPAYLIDIGFGFREVVLFLIVNYLFALVARPPSAKINSMIGVKHTILLRAPIFIAFLAMIMGLGALPQLYYPAAAVGGISLSLYYTSITTEYVRVSDRKREGEEAGLLFGLPHISAVVGPLVGAFVLTVFGFSTLFLMAVALVFASVVPLFLSRDYKGGGFRTRGFGLFLDMKRAAYYFAEGTILITDFSFWGLYVFLNYGFISLGVAASLMGLGMLLFTVVVGRMSNTVRGSRKIVRISGLLLMALWITRALASTELQFMALSLFGGFVITSFRVSLFSDFTRFARKNGPSKSVVFRHSWLEIGRVVPMALLLLLLPGIGALQFIQATFIAAALLSIILVFFKE
jgi:MFS family permease